MQNEGVPGEEGWRGSAKGEPKGGGGVGGEGNLTEEDKKKRGKKISIE